LDHRHIGFLSAVADKLTTALIICAVVLSVGKTQKKFVAIGCINIVVAANAGGAFSPFGDITTLMVWQKGILESPLLFCIDLSCGSQLPHTRHLYTVCCPQGAAQTGDWPGAANQRRGFGDRRPVFLTIVTGISFQNFLHLPPAFGMMTGLAYVKFFAYYLRKKDRTQIDKSDKPTSNKIEGNVDIYDNIAKSEWNTLFFYGVVMALGGLGFIGYLGVTSEFIYGQLGASSANILMGMLSAIVDNIPVMFAVLSMQADNEGTTVAVSDINGVCGG
jgi:Na+/H+ antiporter NhaD/arsenite permease-like protein